MWDSRVLLPPHCEYKLPIKDRYHIRENYSYYCTCMQTNTKLYEQIFRPRSLEMICKYNYHSFVKFHT